MLVDTDVLIWHLRGYPRVTRRLDQTERYRQKSARGDAGAELISNSLTMKAASGIIAFALSAMCGLCFASSHNYDLPVNSVVGAGLTAKQQADKLALENEVFPAIKILLQEAGVLGFTASFAGKKGDIIISASIGYAEKDSHTLLAAGKIPLKLEPNIPTRWYSATKPATLAMLQACIKDGLCNYADITVTAAGLAPWNNITQPWHALCTVRNMAEHTCGLVNGYPLEQPGNLSEDVFVKTGWAKPLSFLQELSWGITFPIQSGVKIGDYNYSNIHYQILAAYIEKKTGMNFYVYAAAKGIVGSSWQEALGTPQLKNSAGRVIRGWEPAQLALDDRFDTGNGDVDTVKYGQSLYNNKDIVRSSEAYNIENGRGGDSWVATPDDVLNFAVNYSGDGTYAPMKQGVFGYQTHNGVGPGVSSMLYRNDNKGYAFAFVANRPTNAQGVIISTALWLKLREIFDAKDMTKYDWNPTVVNSEATEVARSYQYNKAGTLRYFMADPAAVATLDAAIASVPDSGFTRVGASWRMWQVGASGAVPIYRYFCPQWSTHFYGTYSDAKTIQMIYPNADGYSDTCHFEALKLAAMPLNAAGDCNAPLVPLYRAFRSVAGAPNHRYSINPNDFNVAVGYVSEGRAFCVAQGS